MTPGAANTAPLK